MRRTTRGIQMNRLYNILTSRKMKTLTRTAVIGVSFLAVISCTQSVVDHGSTNQVPADVRGPANHGQLGSKELDNTTDVMLESIVSSVDDLRFGDDGRTIITMDRITNRSPLPTEDMEIFLAQLRRKLNTSGIKHRIVFVENPHRAEEARRRVLEEPLIDDYQTPGLRPHYVLGGDIYAIEESASRYWEVFFKLVDLDPNNPIRNEIRWENSSGYRFARP